MGDEEYDYSEPGEYKIDAETAGALGVPGYDVPNGPHHKAEASTYPHPAWIKGEPGWNADGTGWSLEQWAQHKARNDSRMEEQVDTVDIDELITLKRNARAVLSTEINELLNRKKLTAASKLARKLATLPPESVITFKINRRGTEYTYAGIKLHVGVGRVDRWYLTHSTAYVQSPMNNDEMAEYIGTNEVKYVNMFDWNQL